MTVTVTTPDSDVCEYDDCDESYLIPNAIPGGYCSTECADRDTASTVLAHLRRDHRICSTCWRLRKQIEMPTATYRRRFSQLVDDAVVGFEVPTRHVTDGPYGLECNCGTVDHDAEAEWARQFTAYEWTLKLAVEAVRERGEWDYRFDIETFCKCFWETDDLELAVGRALSS